jgi:hypothetical protein
MNPAPAAAIKNIKNAVLNEAPMKTRKSKSKLTLGKEQLKIQMQLAKLCPVLTDDSKNNHPLNWACQDTQYECQFISRKLMIADEVKIFVSQKLGLNPDYIQCNVDTLKDRSKGIFYEIHISIHQHDLVSHSNAIKELNKERPSSLQSFLGLFSCCRCDDSKKPAEPPKAKPQRGSIEFYMQLK